MFRLAHYLCLCLFCLSSLHCQETSSPDDFRAQAMRLLQDDILQLAARQLGEAPVSITDTFCERSAGGRHDFYSEGDYWWPDPTNPDGPYIRKDGLSNPGNFSAHREAMIRLSQIVGNLASAYVITQDKRYPKAIRKHLAAWFIDPDTRMNPHLLFAQAINGRHTGRGIGIIDAIHLMEVVKATMLLEKKQLIPENELVQIKQWFADFVQWLTTHEYGLKEMIHPNNHGTCWNMQVALYAKFVGNQEILNMCRDRFKSEILPNQMAIDGSFPLEMERTKPYGYSLFNLDAMLMNALVLTDQEQDFWQFSTIDGKSISQALAFMAPYVADKSTWPLEPDVMYWENWPVAHPSFIFAAIRFEDEQYYQLWAEHKHFLNTKEVIRNVPIRNPLIWLDEI